MKRVPISVPISSKLLEGTFLNETLILIILLPPFLELLKNWRTKKGQKSWFLDFEKTVEYNLGRISEKLTQRHNRREQVSVEDCDNKRCASTQFSPKQKNHLNDLQEHLEQYRNATPVFGFNSAKQKVLLIKCYLQPNMVDDCDVEPTVIKKAHQFISFKFGDIQLLDIMKLLGGATGFNSPLKACKIQKQEDSSPMEKLIPMTKYRTLNLPPMKPSTKNFVALILLKQNTTISLFY